MQSREDAEPKAAPALQIMLQGLFQASVARARRVRAPRTGPVNADYAALKAIMRERGLLERQPGYYVAVLGMIIVAYALGAGWIAVARGSGAVWLAAPLLAFAAGQITLLGHEAAHRAVFQTARANDLLSFFCINLMNGGNHRWWAGSHNEHHARSNEREWDPDIDYPFLAFSDAQARDKPRSLAPLLARQHWVAPMAMCFVGLSLRAYGFAHFVKHGGRRVDIAAAASFYVVYPSLLVAALGGVRAILFIALQQALYGLYVGSVTSVNHWGMPMPESDHRLDYLRHQTTTSRNLEGGWLSDLWFCGLNRQIEHHLFPTMARNRLRQARPIVRAFCAERGIAYHEVPIVRGYAEMFSTLQRVARDVRHGHVVPSR